MSIYKAIVGCVLFILALEAQTASVVDQSFYSSRANSNGNINVGAQYFGQTFTAGMSGYLTGVNLAINQTANKVGTDMSIGIYSTNGGLPDSLLGEQIITLSGIQMWGNIVNFSTPVPLASGTEYAILVDILDGNTAISPSGLAGIWLGALNGYSAGRSLWGAFNDRWVVNWWGDVFFETYIETSPVPLPASVWFLGSALFGLMGVRRRKG